MKHPFNLTVVYFLTLVLAIEFPTQANLTSSLEMLSHESVQESPFNQCSHPFVHTYWQHTSVADLANIFSGTSDRVPPLRSLWDEHHFSYWAIDFKIKDSTVSIIEINNGRYGGPLSDGAQGVGYRAQQTWRYLANFGMPLYLIADRISRRTIAGEKSLKALGGTVFHDLSSFEKLCAQSLKPSGFVWTDGTKEGDDYDGFTQLQDFQAAHPNLTFF